MSLLSFDDRDGTIWMDGALVDWRMPKRMFLAGLHYASSVFEGERVYSDDIQVAGTYRTVAPLRRNSGQDPHDIDTPEAAKQAVIDAMGIVDGYVRPIAKAEAR